MLGKRRHPARSSGRPVFLLLSVLAVLAMACFPGLAQAEESVRPVYAPEVPKVTGNTNPPKNDKSQANISGTGGATAPGNAGDSDSDSSNGASVGGNPGSGGDGGTGQGSPGDGSKADGGQAGSQQSQQRGPSAVPSTSDDSSSPLIPILIAIALLAAISLGALVYRQRRQRRAPGSPVSPKAS